MKTRQPSSAGDKGEIEMAKCNNYMQGAGVKRGGWWVLLEKWVGKLTLTFYSRHAKLEAGISANDYYFRLPRTMAYYL